jgi:hypothetical protein
MKSWKTTLGGWLIAIGTPMTQVNDPTWVGLLGITFVTLGGVFMTQARDNNVTSEEAHAK